MPGASVSEERKSFAFWAEGLESAERAKRAIKAQEIICNLPQETYRRDMDIRNIRLYENNPVVTLFSYAGNYYAETSTVAMPPPEQSVNNKAKAMIDTMAAQIFSTDQRARCKTVDGNYRQKRRARELQNFADGLAFELKLHKHRKRAGYDSAILESGVGVLMFYRDGGRVAVERCLATEFSIDVQDGLVNGCVQTLYRRRPMARDRVKKVFGGDTTGENAGPNDKAIDGCPNVSIAGAPSDYIEVWEAWHLPSVKGGDDGWHTIAVDHEGGDLLVEPYKKQHFPAVFFKLEDKFTGAWGNSLMTQARGLQVRINMNEYRVQRAIKLFHAGHLYIDRAANMKKSLMSNEIGTVWEGDGPQPPQQLLFNAVTAEMYQNIKSDGELIFANAGINIGASQGASQLGANAPAAAMREETAKSDTRNGPRQQNWEEFHLDCMSVALDLVRDIVTHNDKGEKRTTASGYKVASPGKRGLTVADWSKAAMDQEDYVLEIKAASPIPTDPAGLMAMGERMVEIGAWQPDELAGYMQDLDADSRVNLYESQRRSLEETFEKLLYDKAAAAVPDEFTNVKIALKLGPEYLEQGKEDGVPDKHIDRLRRYLKRCGALVPPPAPPGPPGAGATPPQ